MANDDRLLAGEWPGGAQWEFFLASQVPDTGLCTTAACVALRKLGLQHPEATEVVLTYNPAGRGTASPGSWEMPGGHIDPLDPTDPDGPKETPERAVVREAREEAGYIVASLALFGYRRVTNPPGSRYPELSYTPFYVATTEQPLQTPNDPENPPACGTFRLDSLRRLALAGAIQADELAIIEWGIATCHQ